MSTRLFMDKSPQPDENQLKKVLANNANLWEDIRAHLDQTYGNIHLEWKYYSAKSGWTLKVIHKKRNLFFLVPYDGYFLVAFVFGDRAVALVQSSDLLSTLKEDLMNARKYAEGRGLRFEVHTSADIENINKLVHIKLSPAK